MNINMTSFARPVFEQRRFKYLLVGLITLSLALGLAVVPFEKDQPASRIRTWFDGVWWSTITVTGVGYGDMVPVTMPGRVIGMILAMVGVLAFGLIISMFSIALENTKERYFHKKLFDQLDQIEHRLDKMDKRDQFLMRQDKE
jgi:voltage-gated potassium channel Kch